MKLSLQITESVEWVSNAFKLNLYYYFDVMLYYNTTLEDRLYKL
jgi:hypothetical protein